jgi:hypothetical protein
MWELTKPRVLTMAFEEGCCATDVPEIKRQVGSVLQSLLAFVVRHVSHRKLGSWHVCVAQGLRLDKVAQLVSRVFCEQVSGVAWSWPSPAQLLMSTRCQCADL